MTGLNSHAEAMSEALSSLLDIVRAVARETASEGATGLPVGDRQALLEEVRQTLREDIRAELLKTGSGSGSSPGDIVATCEEQAATLFGSEPWRHQVNLLIQEAFQSVLPSMIKRLRGEVEQAAGSSNEVVNSVEMKEMLEERIRTMLLYLKQEVIPKAIQSQS